MIYLDNLKTRNNRARNAVLRRPHIHKWCILRIIDENIIKQIQNSKYHIHKIL